MASPPPERDGAAGATILVVDDERNIRRTLDLVLRGEGYDVLEAGTAEEALALLDRGEAPVHLAILDIMLPRMSGLELLGRLRGDEATHGLPVIVISGHGTIPDAVQAIRLGAADFIEKPLNRERVLCSVKNALAVSELSRRVARMDAELWARYEMIGESPAMRQLFDDVERVAPTRASVLVTGESGTGKELVCRAIHRRSVRAAGPFVRVHCAAIPSALIESELFGHERGAFTDAHSRKQGLFEQADGGTLLLDEIGEMDLAAQPKVLRALQTGEVSRIGSERPVKVNVRVLSTTNRDLERDVAAGRFRGDLFFRLAVFPMRCPPLRDREGDVRPLAEAFVVAFCKENGLRPKTIDPAAMAALERRFYPGNVRELRNIVERAAILAGPVITVDELPELPAAAPLDDDGKPASSQPGGGPERGPGAERRPTLMEHREEAERRYIAEVLESVDGNVTRAGVVLGVERSNLSKRIRALGIKPPAARG
jgi:two-component system, NtrC family, nitrogen regulation response regulator NtrX